MKLAALKCFILLWFSVFSLSLWKREKSSVCLALGFSGVKNKNQFLVTCTVNEYMKDHTFELRTCEFMVGHRSYTHNLSSCEIKA